MFSSVSSCSATWVWVLHSSTSFAPPTPHASLSPKGRGESWLASMTRTTPPPPHLKGLILFLLFSLLGSTTLLPVPTNWPWSTWILPSPWCSPWSVSWRSSRLASWYVTAFIPASHLPSLPSGCVPSLCWKGSGYHSFSNGSHTWPNCGPVSTAQQTARETRGCVRVIGERAKKTRSPASYSSSHQLWSCQALSAVEGWQNSY